MERLLKLTTKNKAIAAIAMIAYPLFAISANEAVQYKYYFQGGVGQNWDGDKYRSVTEPFNGILRFQSNVNSTANVLNNDSLFVAITTDLSMSVDLKRFGKSFIGETSPSFAISSFDKKMDIGNYTIRILSDDGNVNFDGAFSGWEEGFIDTGLYQGEAGAVELDKALSQVKQGSIQINVDGFRNENNTRDFITSFTRIPEPPILEDSIDDAFLRIFNGTEFVKYDPLGTSFDTSKETIVLSHGWNGLFDYGTEVYEAGWGLNYANAIEHAGHDVNILGYDWTKNASTPIRFGLGTEALVPNDQVKAHGLDLAQELQSINSSLDYDNAFSLIGHSLGAAVSTHATDFLSRTGSGVSIKKLTLLDSPENSRAALLGGKVWLQDELNDIRSNDNDIAIESFWANSLNPLKKAAGADYDNVFSAQVEGAGHGDILDWYGETIYPSTQDTLDFTKDKNGVETSSIVVPYSAPGGKGFSATPALSKVLTQTESDYTYGSLISYDFTDEDGSFSGEYFDPHFLADLDYSCSLFCDDSNSREISYNTVNWESVGPNFITEDGIGQTFVDLENNILTLITGSPVYSYFDFVKDDSTDAFLFDFHAQIFAKGDSLVVYVDGLLLDFWSSGYFTGDWQSSGEIDISFLTAGTHTLMFGFLSDLTGNRLDLRDLTFVSASAASSSVPEPDTLLLFLLSGLGLLLLRLRA